MLEFTHDGVHVRFVRDQQQVQHVWLYMNDMNGYVSAGAGLGLVQSGSAYALCRRGGGPGGECQNDPRCIQPESATAFSAVDFLGSCAQEGVRMASPIDGSDRHSRLGYRTFVLMMATQLVFLIALAGLGAIMGYWSAGFALLGATVLVLSIGGMLLLSRLRYDQAVRLDQPAPSWWVVTAWVALLLAGAAGTHQVLSALGLPATLVTPAVGASVALGLWYLDRIGHSADAV